MCIDFKLWGRLSNLFLHLSDLNIYPYFKAAECDHDVGNAVAGKGSLRSRGHSCETVLSGTVHLAP